MSISPVQKTKMDGNHNYYLPKADFKKIFTITCKALLIISMLGLIFIGIPAFSAPRSLGGDSFASRVAIQPQESSGSPAAAFRPIAEQSSETVSPLPKAEPASLEELPCADRIDAARERLLACPAAKELWDQLSSEGGVSLQCTWIPKMAACRGQDRTILISKDIQDHSTVPAILFEMNNLKRAPKFSHLRRKMCQLSSEDYATKMERLEFSTAKDTHRIAAQCVQSGIWPSAWDEIFEHADESSWTVQQAAAMQLVGHKAGHPWTFEESLKIQEQDGHTQLYRESWRITCDYEKKMRRLEKVRSAVLQSSNFSWARYNDIFYEIADSIPLDD